MINFRCSHCGHNFSVPETYAGKNARCSQCHQPLRIPEPSPSPPTDGTKPALITFHCPHCRQKIGVAQRHAGREITCSKCHQKLHIPQPKKASTQIEKDDRMFVQPVPIDEHTVPAPAAMSDAADNDALHVAPPPMTPDTVRQTKCPQCESLNRADAQVCSFCGETMTARHAAAAPPPSGSIGRAIAAGLGLTFAGVLVWVLLTYLSGWFTLQFLAVGVAALAGCGIRLATTNRTKSMGILAIAIAFLGIIAGKAIIVYAVILPQADSLLQDVTTLSDKQVDEIIQNPNSMFDYACYHLAEELGWDRRFTNKLVWYHNFNALRTRHSARPTMPPEETEKLRDAVKTVRERIAGWSLEEKRQVVLSGFEKRKQHIKAGATKIAGTIVDPNDPNKPPPALVKEGIDIATGEKTFSKSIFGHVFAWGGACCLDFIWIPLGLFLAYKIATKE